jgi:hypothetical protein
MRKLFYIVALLLALSALSLGQITVVNHVGRAQQSSVAINTAATSPSLIVVICGYYSSSGGSIGESGVTANTWHPLTARGGTGSPYYGYVRFYYAYAPNVGTNHVLTCTGTDYPRIEVIAATGTDLTSAVFDKETGVTNGTQPGSLTPAAAGELFITANANAADGVTTDTINSGFTVADYIHDASNGDMGTAYYVNAGSGALNPMWTYGGSTPVEMAAFKAGPLQAATPSATLGTGTYNNAVTESLTDGTSGAAICYRTDGTAPAATVAGTCDSGSTTYSGSFSVLPSTGAGVVKALATKSGMANSSVITWNYTFTVATIVASPAAGTFNSTQSVTLSTASTGALIHYRTDGTAASCSDTTYSSAIAVNASETITAIGCLTNYNNSAAFSGLYTLQLAGTPTATYGTGTYNNAVSESLTYAGAAICYRTDGTAPTAPTAGTCGPGSTTYSGAFNVPPTGGTGSVKALATKAGWSNTSVVTWTYTFNVAAVTALPAAGSFSSSQNVALSTASIGGTVHYRTSGGSAVCGDPSYSSPIAVSVTTTIAAIACQTNYNNSSAFSGLYTINIAAVPVFNPTIGIVPQTPSITTATSGAAICYTADGVTLPVGNGAGGCAVGTQLASGGTITVSNPSTIKAIASKSGYGDSPVASAAYVAAPNPIGIVGHAIAGHDSGTQVAGTYKTIGFDTRGSTLLAGSCSAYGGAGAVMQDTYSNTWVQGISITGSGYSGVTKIFYAYVPNTGTGHQFWCSQGWTAVAVLALNTTLQTSAVLDGCTASAIAAPGSLTPTTYGDIFVTAVGDAYAQATSASIDSSFTISDYTHGSQGQSSDLGMAYLVETPNTAQNPTWTLTGDSPSTAMCAFKSGPLSATAPTAVPSSGTFATPPAPVLSSITTGATIIYTTDATTPTENGSCVPTGTSAAISNGSSIPVLTRNTTVQAMACKTGLSDSGVVTLSYVLQPSTPGISPSGGIFNSPPTVALSQAESKKVCYTLDNSVPTSDGLGNCLNGITYVSPFVINSSATVKAAAVASGWTDSSVGTAAYTLTPIGLIAHALEATGSRATSPVNTVGASLIVVTCHTTFYTISGVEAIPSAGAWNPIRLHGGLSAIVNVNGTSVTSTSGDSLLGFNPGDTVDITGVANTVASVLSATSLVLSNDGGVQTGVILNFGTTAYQGYLGAFYAYGLSIGAASQTFQCLPKTSGITTIVTVWKGTLSTSDPLDQQHGSNTDFIPGSILPMQSGELFVTGFNNGNQSTTTFSVDSGFTISDSETTGASDGAQAYFVNPNSSAMNPSWAATDGAYRTTNLFSFKAAAPLSPFVTVIF